MVFKCSKCGVNKEQSNTPDNNECAMCEIDDLFYKRYKREDVNRCPKCNGELKNNRCEDCMHVEEVQKKKYQSMQKILLWTMITLPIIGAIIVVVDYMEINPLSLIVVLLFLIWKKIPPR